MDNYAIRQVMCAGQVVFDYTVKDGKLVIPRDSDPEKLMRIISGLVYTNLKHIEIDSRQIIVFPDDKVSLEIKGGI